MLIAAAPALLACNWLIDAGIATTIKTASRTARHTPADLSQFQHFLDGKGSPDAPSTQAQIVMADEATSVGSVDIGPRGLSSRFALRVGPCLGLLCHFVACPAAVVVCAALAAAATAAAAPRLPVPPAVSTNAACAAAIATLAALLVAAIAPAAALNQSSADFMTRFSALTHLRATDIQYGTTEFCRRNRQTFRQVALYVVYAILCAVQRVPAAFARATPQGNWLISMLDGLVRPLMWATALIHVIDITVLSWPFFSLPSAVTYITVLCCAPILAEIAMLGDSDRRSPRRVANIAACAALALAAATFFKPDLSQATGVRHMSMASVPLDDILVSWTFAGWLNMVPKVAVTAAKAVAVPWRVPDAAAITAAVTAGGTGLGLLPALCTNGWLLCTVAAAAQLHTVSLLARGVAAACGDAREDLTWRSVLRCVGLAAAVARLFVTAILGAWAWAALR